MQTLPNDIVLRPRFQLEIHERKDKILETFEKSEAIPFLIKRLDEHIFIKFKSDQRHFWSPQLHLELNELENHKCVIYGVFGPNPMLWTFFMFLNFGVATLFIILAVWAYSSASLNKPYNLQLSLMGLMVVVWFLLYFFGRMGKRKGKPQILQLYGYMADTLHEHDCLKKIQ